MKYYSPLRYPGGKNKAFTLFRDIIAINRLQGCVYVEPFAGGASVALGLLSEGDAERIVINDADPSIYSFWLSCLTRTDKLCELMGHTEINTEVWEQQKAIYYELRSRALRGEKYDITRLGFATFFLNRTNRSGILKGGIIGGRAQEGKYGIGARFNKKELEKRIRKVADLSDRIELHCEDAKTFLESNLAKWPHNTLIYCDPPYVQKGQGLYMNYFKEKDHKELSETILEIRDKRWIVTYDMDDLIKELYRDYLKKKLTLSYSAAHSQGGSKSGEYIFFSSGLSIPDNEMLTDLY
jgi:DNA adenine methylase